MRHAETLHPAAPSQMPEAALATVIQFPSPSDRGFLLEVDPSVRPDHLASFDLDPVLDPIPGLGRVCLNGVRKTGGLKPDQPVRTHRMYDLDLSGYQNAIEITDPIDGDPQFTVVSFPGFTEHIECGIRKKMQSHLSYIFPQARIVSVSSDGIGLRSGHYNWSERHNHGLDGMAARRLEIAQTLAGKLPLFIQGTSMGSVISHRMAQQVLNTNPAERTVNLRGQFLISPALVDPSNAKKDMGVQFVPKLVWDLTKELGTKTGPRELIQIVKIGRRYGITKSDMVALANQAWDLMHGTPEEAVRDVVSQVPTTVVAGATDNLAQWPMWQRIQRDYPDMLDLHVVANRGHSLAIKPSKTCEKLARTGQAQVYLNLAEASN